MSEDTTTFHRRTAEELDARYHGDEAAPSGWREIAAWHWEQTNALAEAAGLLLEAAEACINRFDFGGARQRVERTLELLDALEPEQRRRDELRAYALALAVLEFGGQYREGLTYARQMVRVAQDRHSRVAVAQSLLAVGRMQRGLGQLANAEMILQQARELAEREEQGELEATIRLQLAKVHQLQGRHMEALQELQLAREEQAQHDDQRKLAHIFTGMGDVYQALGASREALLFYNRALALQQGQNTPISRAILKEKSALVLLAQGKLEEARGEIKESLQMRDDVGDVVGQARAHSVLGTILGRMKQHEAAIAEHEAAMALDEQTQNQRGQSVALLHLGDEATALGRYDMAQSYYKRALIMAQAISDDVARARALERLGDLSITDGKPEAATVHWNAALTLRESLGHADEAAALRRRIENGYIPRRR